MGCDGDVHKRVRDELGNAHPRYTGFKVYSNKLLRSCDV